MDSKVSNRNHHKGLFQGVFGNVFHTAHLSNENESGNIITPPYIQRLSLYTCVFVNVLFIYPLADFLIMPYKSIEGAKKANFPTTAEKVPLTLAQINHLARIYDGVQKSGSADNPMAVAWARWKEVYTKTDGKWKLKEGKSGISDALTPPAKEGGWIPVAKVGQEVRMSSVEEDNSKIPQNVYPTAEGFEKAVELFKEIAEKGYVGKNHLEVLEGMEVTDQKFEFPFLYAKFNQEGEAAIKDPKSTGRSIDATVFGVEGHLLTDFLVPGVSVLFEPHNPACTPEMGCSSTSAKTSSYESKIDFDLVVMNNNGENVKVRDVNMYLDKEEMKDKEKVKDQLLAEVAYLDYQTSCMFIPHNPALRIGDVVPSDVKPLYTIQIAISAKGEIEVDYHEGGGKKKMVEKEGEPVTFTEGQVKERIATAVSEVTEKLDNAHAVVVTDLEKANEAKIAELGTEHETAIDAARVAAMKQAEARATFMHNFGLKEDSELMKSYDKVETVEDMRELMNSIEIPKMAAAALGISSVSGGKPETERDEVLGAWDPVKGEFGKAYRGEK